MGFRYLKWVEVDFRLKIQFSDRSLFDQIYVKICCQKNSVVAVCVFMYYLLKIFDQLLESLIWHIEESVLTHGFAHSNQLKHTLDSD